MKMIGLIGGMSWQSSIEYYRIINETAASQLGGSHSAKSIMVSVDFADIEALQMAGEWAEMGEILVSCARQLQDAGADFVLICTNTMHLLAEEVQDNIKIPLLHIADTAAPQMATDRLVETCPKLFGGAEYWPTVHRPARRHRGRCYLDDRGARGSGLA